MMIPEMPEKEIPQSEIEVGANGEGRPGSDDDDQEEDCSASIREG